MDAQRLRDLADEYSYALVADDTKLLHAAAEELERLRELETLCKSYGEVDIAIDIDCDNDTGKASDWKLIDTHVEWYESLRKRCREIAKGGE